MTTETGELEELDDDTIQLQDEFNKLKQKKKKSLDDKLSQINKDNITENQNKKVLNGVVTEMNNINEKSVEIIVEYINENEKKKSEYTLQKPTSKEEFNVNNDFVRLVNFFGDRKNDPSSLKYRDVWLKQEDGSVKLHIPEDLKIRTKIKEKASRFIMKHNLDEFETLFQSHNIYTLSCIAVIYLMFLVMRNIFLSYNFDALMSFFMFGTCFSILSVFFIGLISALSDSMKLYKKLVKLFAIVLTVTSFAYVIGITELTYDLTYVDGTAKISLSTDYVKEIINTLIIISPVYLPTYMLIKNHKSLQKTQSKLRELKSGLYDKIKRKYQTARGIEFVDMKD